MECQTLGFALTKFTDRQIVLHIDACSTGGKKPLLPVIWKLTCFGWQITLSLLVGNSQFRKEFFSD